MEFNKKTIINTGATIFSLVLVTLGFYFGYSTINIDEYSVESAIGGLGEEARDMSYAWKELPEGVEEGDEITINFNNGDADLTSKCKITAFKEGEDIERPDSTNYYCRVTWPVDNFHEAWEDIGVQFKDAYNPEYYRYKTDLPFIRFFKYQLQKLL